MRSRSTRQASSPCLSFEVCRLPANLCHDGAIGEVDCFAGVRSSFRWHNAGIQVGERKSGHKPVSSRVELERVASQNVTRTT